MDEAVEQLTSLIEPLTMAVLGVLVGGLIIAMYLPVFQLWRRLRRLIHHQAVAGSPVLNGPTISAVIQPP